MSFRTRFSLSLSFSLSSRPPPQAPMTTDEGQRGKRRNTHARTHAEVLGRDRQKRNHRHLAWFLSTTAPLMMMVMDAFSSSSLSHYRLCIKRRSSLPEKERYSQRAEALVSSLRKKAPVQSCSAHTGHTRARRWITNSQSRLRRRRGGDSGSLTHCWSGFVCICRTMLQYVCGCAEQNNRISDVPGVELGRPFDSCDCH